MSFELDSIYFAPPHDSFLADDSRGESPPPSLYRGHKFYGLWGLYLVLELAMFRRKGESRTFLTLFSYGMILAVLAFLWTSLDVRLGPCHPENPYDVRCFNQVDFAYLSAPTRYGLLALLACHAWFWLVTRAVPAARSPKNL
jgi:hypothetical protein